MDFEGKVTGRNFFFKFFTLNEDKRVYLSLLSPVPSLPRVGTNIKILKGALRQGDTFVIEDPLKIEGLTNSKCVPTRFTQFVTENSLRPSHILNVDQWQKILVKKFPAMNVSQQQDIIMTLLIFVNSDSELNSPHFSLKTVSDIQYVNVDKNYTGFPPYSFGVHRPTNYIFGYLQIEPIYGFVTLSDMTYQFACVYRNLEKRNIEEFLNSYVILEFYLVITEVFSEVNANNYEYLYFDISAVKKINSTEIIKPLIPSDHSQAYSLFNMSFVVIKKSTAYWNNEYASKESNFFLEVLILEKNFEISAARVILQMPKEFADKMFIIRESGTYKLYFCKPLLRISKPVISKTIPIFDMTDKAAFLYTFYLFGPSVHVEARQARVLTMLQCKDYVTQGNTLPITFAGVIKEKRLIVNNYVRKKSDGRKLYGFGTSGSKTHHLIFSHKIKKGQVIFLDMYLNDWEHNLMPLGLIPEMELIVHNASPHSGKYLKSGPFTRFEVVRYKPRVNFATINLHINFQHDNRPTCLLSKGLKMPPEIVVWGAATTFKIVELNFRNVCSHCEHLSLLQHCSIGHSIGRKLKFEMILKVRDIGGISLIKFDNIELLKPIFRLKNAEYISIIEVFHYVEHFRHTLFPHQVEKNVNETRDQAKAKELLKKYICFLNRLKISMMFKVRLQKCAGKTPVWYALDAKPA